VLLVPEELNSRTIHRIGRPEMDQPQVFLGVEDRVECFLTTLKTRRQRYTRGVSRVRAARGFDALSRERAEREDHRCRGEILESSAAPKPATARVACRCIGALAPNAIELNALEQAIARCDGRRHAREHSHLRGGVSEGRDLGREGWSGWQRRLDG